MRLYLVRHGEAAANDGEGEPELSEWGKFEVEKTGVELSGRVENLDIIFHSEKLRAQQTAAIIQMKLKFTSTIPLNEMEGLKPNDSADEIAGWASEIENDIMLVGHLPFMDKLVGLLLKNSDEKFSYSFGTACVACFERHKSGEWAFIWFFSPQ